MYSDRVLLLGDTPTIFTGFAQHGGSIAWMLSHKYDVYYLGFHTVGAEPQSCTIKRQGISRTFTLLPGLYSAEQYQQYPNGYLQFWKWYLEIEPDIIFCFTDYQFYDYIFDFLYPRQAQVDIRERAMKQYFSKRTMYKITKRLMEKPMEYSKIRAKVLAYAMHDGDAPYEGWSMIYNLSDKLIVLSHFAQEIMKKRFNIEIPDDDVVYVPVDTQMFKPMKSEKGDLFIVGNYNRNQIRKQPIRTLEAFSIFAKDKEDVRLYLHMNPNDPFGYPIEYYLKNVYKDLWQKILVPQKFPVEFEEIPKIINTFDINLNTHAGEGFGHVALEGFACGKPYVATDYTTTQELVNLGEPKPRGLAIPFDTYYFERPNLAAAQRAMINTKECAKALDFYYKNRDVLEEHGKNAYNWVQQYSVSSLMPVYIRKVEETLCK